MVAEDFRVVRLGGDGKVKMLWLAFMYFEVEIIHFVKEKSNDLCSWLRLFIRLVNEDLLTGDKESWAFV